MIKQGPSNGWELETRRILETQLPEYDVDPHMRLANVVKGRARFVKAMSQYEIDYTVREKETGKVICAIELDGPTHDTADGQRRDANKNKWLYEAEIPLIRIREPKEAYAIREKLKLDEGRPAFMMPKQKNPVTKYIGNLIAIFSIVGLLMWTLNTVAQRALSNIGKNSMTQMKQHNTTAQPTPATINWQKQQEAEQAEAKRRIEAQQPRYERVLVKGKSARECKNDRGVLDNNTIKCMNDHYEMVQISGTQ